MPTKYSLAELESAGITLATHDIVWNADETLAEVFPLRWTDDASYARYQADDSAAYEADRAEEEEIYKLAQVSYAADPRAAIVYFTKPASQDDCPF